MSKRDWTSGTWAQRGLSVSVDHQGIVANCPTPQNGGTFNCSANACLIAAAPALYEALENARRSMIVSVTGISDGLTIHDIRSWIEQADGALAAANPKPGA